MAGARQLPATATHLMGLLVLLALGFAAAALLWRLGVARPLWSIAGAALMLGAAGYALQGRPLLAGMPRQANSVPIDVPAEAVVLRDQMFGARFTTDGAFLIVADAMLRAGDAGAATGWTLAGIRQAPKSAVLWTELGITLAAHDGAQVSPTALFAFEQAIRLDPKHPGPPFFLGLAYLTGQHFEEARPYWARALALCPPAAPYRRAIGERLILLDAYLAQMRAAGRESAQSVR